MYFFNASSPKHKFETLALHFEKLSEVKFVILCHILTFSCDYGKNNMPEFRTCVKFYVLKYVSSFSTQKLTNHTSKILTFEVNQNLF